jgi:hypothetical protein
MSKVTTPETPETNLTPEPLASRVVWPMALLVFLGFVYFWSMCPTIYPGDGPELTSAAWCLGVPHPTGYPLFMAMGFVAQRMVWFAEPAWVMNALTALCSLLAALGVYQLALKVMGLSLGDERNDTRVARWAAFGTALLTCLGAGWWSASNSTEVYALLMAFVAWIWVLGFRLIELPSRKRLFQLAALTGVAFLHHQLVLVTLPMSLAAVVKWWRSGGGSAKPELSGRIKVLLMSLVVGMIPLLGYAYLPIRAASEPAINVGDPASFERFSDHVRGGQYKSLKVLTLNNRQMNAGQITQHLKQRASGIVVWMGSQVVVLRPSVMEDGSSAMGRQRQAMEENMRKVRDWSGKARIADHHRAAMLGLLLLALAGVGAGCLFHKDPFVVVGLLGGFLLNLIAVMLYSIADISIYQLPMWLLIVVFATSAPVVAGEMLADMSDHDDRDRERWMKRVMGVGAATCLLALLSVWNYRTPGNGVVKQDSKQALVFANAVMTTLPENAVVFTEGDFDIYPLWYAQAVEEQRPDVAVIGSMFIFSGWYEAMLRTNLPEGVEVYVRDHPPQGPGLWLEAFVGGAVAPQLMDGRPVYISLTPGSPNMRLLEPTGLQITPEFRFPTNLPDDHPGFGNPQVFYRITADADFIRARYNAFMNSPRFPDADKYMVSGE